MQLMMAYYMFGSKQITWTGDYIFILISVKIWIQIKRCSYKKLTLKSRLQNGYHLVSALMCQYRFH